MLVCRSIEDIVQHSRVTKVHVVHVDQMLWFLPLRIHFPFLSICFGLFAVLIHVSLFLVSLPFVASVSSGLRKSWISSSHLLFGLPTALHVLIVILRPRFYSAAFLAHRFSGSDVSLIANRTFILLCVSIQHGILAAFIRSSVSAVLSPHVFDPLFLFNFCCVDFFISIIHDRDVAVLVTICV